MTPARDVLVEAFLQSRASLASGIRPEREGHRRLIDELVERLGDSDTEGFNPEQLGLTLETIAGTNEERRATLVDVAGMAARSISRTAPFDEGGALVWRVLIALVDHVYGSGIHPLGRLPFITDQLLALLVEEANAQLAEERDQAPRRVGAPGRLLANLAVSRKLRESLSSAFGFPVTPTYSAVYLYDSPGSEVRAHVDARDHELEFHLVLEHALPRDGSGGSALLAHLPRRPQPTRVELAPGEAVALRARGTIHAWEPMQKDESRTLIGIGFQPVR